MENCLQHARRILALEQAAYIRQCRHALSHLETDFDTLSEDEQAEARYLFSCLHNLIEWLKKDEDL